MTHIRTLLLGAVVVGSLALPIAASAQAYTPTSNDVVTIQDRALGNHRVNAYSYIQTAQAASGLCQTTPTIGTTFGTADSVVKFSASCTLSINIGTSNTGTGIITFPAAAPNGWACFATDITTTSTTQAQIKQITTGSSTTACALQNYSDIAGTHAMTDSDILYVTAVPF